MGIHLFTGVHTGCKLLDPVFSRERIVSLIKQKLQTGKNWKKNLTWQFQRNLPKQEKQSLKKKATKEKKTLVERF